MIPGWLTALFKILGEALGLTNKALDRQAGIDAAQKQMTEGENVLLREEIRGREALHRAQDTIDATADDEKTKLRKNPNGIFREGGS